MGSNGWDFGMRLVEIVMTVWGIKLFDTWNERRRERKRESDITRNNLDNDYTRTSQVLPILEDIKYALKADRVMESAFSNGDVTFSGIHMKKLSIVCETDHINPVAPHLQLVPVKQYGRNMDILYNATEDYAILQEHNKMDELSSLNGRFGLLSMLAVKVRDERGRWIGLITASWKEPYNPTMDDISYMKTMVSRVAGIKP